MEYIPGQAAVPGILIGYVVHHLVNFPLDELFIGVCFGEQKSPFLDKYQSARITKAEHVIVKRRLDINVLLCRVDYNEDIGNLIRQS